MRGAHLCVTTYRELPFLAYAHLQQRRSLLQLFMVAQEKERYAYRSAIGLIGSCSVILAEEAILYRTELLLPSGPINDAVSTESFLTTHGSQ